MMEQRNRENRNIYREKEDRRLMQLNYLQVIRYTE